MSDQRKSLRSFSCVTLLKSGAAKKLQRDFFSQRSHTRRLKPTFHPTLPSPSCQSSAVPFTPVRRLHTLIPLLVLMSFGWRRAQSMSVCKIRGRDPIGQVGSFLIHSSFLESVIVHWPVVINDWTSYAALDQRDKSTPSTLTRGPGRRPLH